MNDEELNIKFKQIAQMLGKENVNVPDNLGSILAMLANSAPKEQSPPKQEDTQPTVEKKETKEEAPSRSNNDDNMEMMRKVTTLMNSMKNINDPRVNLLTAITPFLNNTRQKKVSNCIKLFQMTQLTRMMTEMEKNS